MDAEALPEVSCVSGQRLEDVLVQLHEEGSRLGRLWEEKATNER